MKAKLFAIAVIVILSSHFFACSDSGDILTTGQKTNVSGKVIGGFFNYGTPNIKIQIEDKVTFSDNYGRFYISNVSVPYDIYLRDTTLDKGTVIRNLSLSECWIPYTAKNPPTNTPTGTIKVSLNNITGYKNNWKIFFSDGKNYNGISNVESDSTGSVDVVIWDNSIVTGKVFVLNYSMTGGEITSFDKFGYIDNVSISAGGVVNLVFNDSMLTFNPPEALISGTISGIPPHTNMFPTFTSISFSPRKYNAYFTDNCLYNISSSNFNLVIPSNLPVNFYPFMEINLSDSGGFGYNKCLVKYLLPKNGAVGLNINIPESPQIISPPANSYIDTNNIISFLSSSPDRVFCIRFEDSTLLSYDIYTTSENINMNNLWKLGIKSFTPNTRVAVGVTAYIGAKNINEYFNPNADNIAYSIPKWVSNLYYMKP
jgi:hypothetical protein